MRTGWSGCASSSKPCRSRSKRRLARLSCAFARTASRCTTSRRCRVAPWAARRSRWKTSTLSGAIVAEGDAADGWYVLVSGRARVIKRADNGDEIPLNILRAGDSFGEVELLAGARRPATVRASSDVLALRLDRSAFAGLLERTP